MQPQLRCAGSRRAPVSSEPEAELVLLAPPLSARQEVAGWHYVDSSRFAVVACNPQRALYYKAFLPRGWPERLKALLRGGRGRRARDNSDALLHCGFPAPVNVLWGRTPGGAEYLFTRLVPGDPVPQWLRRFADAGAADRRRTFLRALGTQVGRLHGSGFVHGDLRPGNILADRQGERYRFTFIDNESNSRHREVPGKLLLKNLVQLNMLPAHQLSRSDRWRFFRAWASQMSALEPVESRVLARAAYDTAMRRMRRKQAERADYAAF